MPVTPPSSPWGPQRITYGTNLPVEVEQVDNFDEGFGSAGSTYTASSGIAQGGNLASGATWVYDPTWIAPGSRMGSRFDVPATTGNANRFVAINGVAPGVGTGKAFAILGVAFYDAFPTSNTPIANLRLNNVQQCGLQWTTTGTMQLRDLNTVRYTSSTVLTLGSLFYLEVQVDLPAQKMYLRISDANGHLIEDSGPQTYTNGGAVDQWNIGMLGNPGPATHAFVTYWGYSTEDWVGPPLGTKNPYQPPVPRRTPLSVMERRTKVASPPWGMQMLNGDANSFEGGTTGNWTGGVTAPTLANSTTQAFTGTHSLKVTATAANDWNIITPLLTTAAGVQPGYWFLGTAWVYCETNARNFRIQFDWKNSGGTVVAGSSLGNLATGVVGQWVQATLLFNAPANQAVTNMTMQVVVKTAAISDVFYVDDIELTLVSATLPDWKTGPIVFHTGRRGQPIRTQHRRTFVAPIPLLGQAAPQPPVPQAVRIRLAPIPVMRPHARTAQPPLPPPPSPPTIRRRVVLVPSIRRQPRPVAAPFPPAVWLPSVAPRRGPPRLAPRRTFIANVPTAAVVVTTPALPPQPLVRRPRVPVLRRTFVARVPLVGLAPPQPLVPQPPQQEPRRRPVLVRRTFVARVPLVGLAPPQSLIPQPPTPRRRPTLLRRTFVGRQPLLGQAPAQQPIPQPVRDRLFWFPRPRGRSAAPPLTGATVVTAQALPPQPVRRLARIEPFVTRLRHRRDDVEPIGTPVLSGDDTSFEGGVGNWVGAGANPPTLSTSTTQAVNGVQSLKAVATGTSGTLVRSGASPLIKTVHPGDTIRLTGWIYPETNARAITLTFGWFQQNGNSASPQFNVGIGTPTLGQWTAWSIQTVVPSVPGLVKCSIDITINNPAVSDVFYFDAIDLRIRSHVEPTWPPIAVSRGRHLAPPLLLFRRGRTAAPPLVGAQPTIQALPPQPPTPRRRPTFMRRGSWTQPQVNGLPLYSRDTSSFEGGVGGWSGSSATVAQSSTQAYQGTQSLKMTATSGPTTAQAVGPAADVMAITGFGPGLRYRASTWVYAETNNRTIGLQVGWSNSAGFFIGATNTQVAVTTGAWTQIVHSGTIGSIPGLNRLTITVFAGSPATNDVFYIDDVELEIVGFTPPQFTPPQWTARNSRRVPYARLLRRGRTAAVTPVGAPPTVPPSVNRTWRRFPAFRWFPIRRGRQSEAPRPLPFHIATSVTVVTENLPGDTVTGKFSTPTVTENKPGDSVTGSKSSSTTVTD